MELNNFCTFLKAAAEAALELHHRELEPGRSINVYISNPERKKERTDHDADEREVYVAGLSKFTEKSDLEKVFRTVSVIRVLLTLQLTLQIVWPNQGYQDGSRRWWTGERIRFCGV